MRDHVRQSHDLQTGEWHVSLELRDEEFRALGHVAAQWAFLENMLRKLTRDVAEALKQPLHKDFESDSFRRRNAALRNLVMGLPADKDREKLIELLERAGSLQGERQRLIHGLLEWNEDDRDKLNVQTHKNPNGAAWTITAEGIEAIANKISSLNCAIWNWPNSNPWETICDEVGEQGAYFGGLGRDPGTPAKLSDEELSKFTSPLLKAMKTATPEKE